MMGCVKAGSRGSDVGWIIYKIVKVGKGQVSELGV